MVACVYHVVNVDLNDLPSMSDGTTSEHQTSVVCEAEPQKEDAPLTSSGDKTDSPMKHSSEEPGGNVKKKVPIFTRI